MANALAEQTAWTWQAVDLLLIDTARWYQEDALKIPAGDIDSVLAHRTAGTWVRLITITDAHGIQRHRSQGVAPPDLNLSGRDYFIALRDHASTSLQISGPLVTRSTGRSAIVFARALEDEHGQFAGVVTAIVDMEDLRRFYSAVDLGMGTSTYLLRDDGTLLLRNPPALSKVGRKFAALADAQSVPAAGIANPTRPEARHPGCLLARPHSQVMPPSVR